MAYTHTTFTVAKSLLADRLGDAGKVFWTDAELGFAIVEAKRIWNAITLHDRDTGYLSTANGTVFYSLSTNLRNTAAEYVRAMTVRDRAIVSEIEYQLMEPQNLTAWSGTDQFTFNQILTAVQRRRDQFLADTACILTERTDAVTGGADGTVVFPDTVIGIRRAVYVDTGGKYSTLRTSDERLANIRGNWHESATPTSYSTSAQPNLQVQLIPPPANTGTLKTLVVNSGATLDTTANSNVGTLLGVPDDVSWGVKYGALADLLSDAYSVDSSLAELCEAKYELAVDLTLRMPVVLNSEINGVPGVPSPLSGLDMQNGWQGLRRQVPTQIGIAGPDTIAAYKTPNGVYDIGLSVVRNAIVPSAGTDYLEIGREHLDVLLGMAQRICMFKVGGAEFTATEPLANKFFSQAAQYSYRRSAAAASLQTMNMSTGQEMNRNPWASTPRTVEDNSDEVKSERNARRRPFRKR